MIEVTVTTQAEFDAVVAAGNIAACAGGHISLTIGGMLRPRIVVKAGAFLRLEARESSQPHVEAWGSSQPHVEAKGWVLLRIFGQVIARLSATVTCYIHGSGASVEGGRQTVCPAPATAEEWCEFYGADVADGIAALFKAVDADFKSGCGFAYVPGSVPIAPDWDGGEMECGGGLHFSPHPMMAKSFFSQATRYVACPVALADIVVHANAQHPTKIKARGCCGPVVECDRYGRPMAPSPEAEAPA